MSLENVKAKVLEDAGARAAAELEKAKQEAERILAEGRAADERNHAESVRDATIRLDRETTRELERLDHDNRLQILHAKNQAIDEVFKRVMRKLRDMPESEYVGLVGKWLAKLPADAGGKLRVNPKDEEKFVSGLSALNQGRSGGGVFTGVEADPAVHDGAIVEGPDYSIDCTAHRRLHELRELSVGEVARALFGK